MSKSIFFGYILLFAAFASFANAKDKSFEIIKPLNKSIYDEDYASIVIKRVDKSLKKITVLENEDIIAEFATDKKRDIYCKTIRLKLGKNRINLVGYTEKGNLTNKEIDIFYRSEIHKGVDEAPDEYSRNFFHTNKNEKFCKSCHNMEKDRATKLKKHISSSEINAKEFDVIENPEDSNCYTCHKVITFRKNGHAPAVNFLCTACHTGKSGEFNIEDEGKSKYLMPDPIMNRCFKCHEGVKEKWFSNTSEHGPLRSGRCNKCHNPHSSDFEFHLRKPIWELCTTCHAEKANGKHVIGSFVFNRNSGGHPTRGRPDPSRPGRDLVCSSCHNPHGSNGIFLLRTKGKTAYSVCQRCHKK